MIDWDWGLRIGNVDLGLGFGMWIGDWGLGIEDNIGARIQDFNKLLILVF